MDWYPWGPEAFARATEEERPILLSIGYSACHWCHVMERESFDDEVTAELINREFIPIKVDREERPDVDAIYMGAVQALSGHGGWPLTVFLTPQGAPFFGGTYFPPEPRHRLPSFRQVLASTAEAWRERRNEVEGAAEEIGTLLRRLNEHPIGSEPNHEIPSTTRPARRLVALADPAHGGFGTAPKFPQPVVLEFLLRHHARTRDEDALSTALRTLEGMAAGGIRDQLGGGFHRYSVDERWLVPHFEKMLYDNALLAGTYLRAHQLTGDTDHAEVCRDILEDLLATFRSPDGAFYSAWDADSEGEEGRFYVWTPDEVVDALGEEEGGLFARCYDVSEGGNFEGKTILHVPHPLDAVAHREGLSASDLSRRLAHARRALALVRSDRPPPLRDEKVLASWNALAVRAFAEAGAALDEHRFVEAAATAAGWLLTTLRPDGRLHHQWTAGRVAIPAFLDDVAGLGNACLSLHEATLDHRWLEAAFALEAEVEERFRDPESRSLYDTPADGEALLLRPRGIMDNPTPSGTSLAAELSLRLGVLSGDPSRMERARSLVELAAAGLERMPTAFGRLLSVADRLEADPVEIAIVGQRHDARTRDLLREAHASFLPNRVISGFDPGETSSGSIRDLPLFEGRRAVDGPPVAFVCRRFACQTPTSDPTELADQLTALGP